MKITIEKQAVKFLKSLQYNQRQLILNGIAGLAVQPPQGDIKPLKGYKAEDIASVSENTALYTGMIQMMKSKYSSLWILEVVEIFISENRKGCILCHRLHNRQ